MSMSSNKLACLVFGLLISWGALAADTVAVNPDHPDRYVVVRGDTLWDIAGRFLRDPWRWPDVWYVNPQIANPHLIYPGDIITMTYVNGQLRLGLERGSTVKLSPRVRSTPLDGAIPAIPLDAIHQFLTRPYVLNEGELDAAPYVVAFAEEHILGSNDLKAYVRSIANSDNTKFDVVRPGDAYKDAETGEILGYEALYISSSELLDSGDPATVLLSDMELESRKGDRLLPVTEDTPLNAFFPAAPRREVNGSIISVLNGVTQIGQYNVVVLDRGARDGLEPGSVLTIDHRGETIRDTVSGNPGETVTLPDEPAGTLMVFRTFDRVSFGLVMDATRAIHVRDRVHNP
ncbi:MAG: LysM peptidoglycan-binding domain-containing protein [Sedimenticola sp.]|nr:LysM peptidoglycan-binding domain-containing protein [Sedimenticola sp.]